MTGVNFLVGEVTAKRLDLLRELVPNATRITVLVNPADSTNAPTTLKDVEPAARARGMQIQVLRASSGEINAAFVAIGRERPDALFVSAGPFFQARRIQLAQLAAFHRLPAMYPLRQNAEAGGLMSYGTNLTDGFRQAGVYAGRILKGAKPADLPVIQASKFELLINLQTAEMLGLTVPPQLLARADEVIE